MHHPTDFTTTEHQLLQAISAGASNKIIARQLGKSEFTVRNQLSSVFKKISAQNRTQAAGWYREYQQRANGTSVPLRAAQSFGKMLKNEELDQ